MALKREQVVRSAEKYVSRGKIDAAIREYHKVLAEQPDDTATLNRIGDLYARADRLDEAVRTFTQIAERYTADGFFVKAIAIYKKIIKLDPTRLEIYEKLAELYHRQGLLNEARTQYQVLADYYLKHDNATSATSIYERMAEVDPDDPGLRAKLAELYQELKLTDKAMAQYTAIAEMMLAHGHVEEAEQVYLRALDVDAENAGFLTDATLKLRESAGNAAAARLLAAAAERNPQAERVARMVGLEGAGAGPQGEPGEAPEPRTEAAAPAGGTPPGEVPAAEEEAPAEEIALGAGDDAALVLDLDEAVDLDVGIDLEAGADLAGDLDVSEERAPQRAAPVAPPAPESPASESRPLHDEIELDLDEVFDLDLDDDEPPASLVQPPPDMLEEPPAAEGSAAESETEPQFEFDFARGRGLAASAELEIDPDLLERTAAELEPERVRQEEDLITEAEVLSKYGLAAKAAERVAELLELNPKHPGGLALGVRLHLEAEEPRPAARLAERLAEVTGAAGDTWSHTARRLEAAGFEVDGVRLTLPPGAEDEEEEEADTTPGLETLAGTEAAEAGEPEIGELEPAGEAAAPAVSPPSVPPDAAAPAAATGETAPPAARRASRRGGRAVDDMLAELASGMQPSAKRRPAGAPRSPEPQAPAASESPVAAGPTPVQPASPSGAAPPVAPVPPGADRPPAAGAPAAPAGADADADFAPSDLAGGLFGGGGDDFFDLAAELEEELAREAAMEGDELLLPQPKEQSLEEIVAGFKKGVEEALSSEDYGTHFDLGIAYREMGLLDEAIGEFQIAAKDPARLVECCSMLGLSFLDKGLPELAIRWYKRGLAAPNLGEDDQLGLLYDLGNAYHALGERDEAYRTFVEIYGTNSHYRDVVAKLEETAPRR